MFCHFFKAIKNHCPFVRRKTMDARIMTLRGALSTLKNEHAQQLKYRDNIIRWLRWKLYGGIEAPGHRPIAGFGPSGGPIFKEPGTSFWPCKEKQETV